MEAQGFGKGAPNSVRSVRGRSCIPCIVRAESLPTQRKNQRKKKKIKKAQDSGFPAKNRHIAWKTAEISQVPTHGPPLLAYAKADPVYETLNWWEAPDESTVSIQDPATSPLANAYQLFMIYRAFTWDRERRKGLTYEWMEDSDSMEYYHAAHRTALHLKYIEEVMKAFPEDKPQIRLHERVDFPLSICCGLPRSE